MSRHDAILIHLAVQVLRDALDQSKHGTQQTPAVRLALRTLLPHVSERWPLENFWDGAGTENDIGRFQSMNAALNGIVLRLPRCVDV